MEFMDYFNFIFYFQYIIEYIKNIVRPNGFFKKNSVLFDIIIN